jgi:hypothetical protein
LNIVKYEPPIPAELAGKVKGHFPSFLRKTDEERCLSGDTVIITENGPKKIQEICETKYTGKVLCYDPVTDTDVWNLVNSYSIQKNVNDWLEIELETGEKIIMTCNHKVWMPDLLCYREAVDLTEGVFIKKTDYVQFS